MSDLSVTRFSLEEVTKLAASAVAKVDLMGPRGTTLCSMDEIEAMALCLAGSGILTGPNGEHPLQPFFPQIDKDNEPRGNIE